MTKLIKKIGIVLSLMIATSMISYAASSISGVWVKYNGKWYHGTIFSQGTTYIKNGFVYADPPWAFIADDKDNTAFGGNTGGKLPYSPREPMMVYKKLNYELGIGDVLSYKSDNSLNVKIFNLETGEKVFEALDATELQLVKGTDYKDNINYIIQISDANGYSESIMFSVGPSTVIKKEVE